jgi:hypothetical protein
MKNFAIQGRELKTYTTQNGRGNYRDKFKDIAAPIAVNIHPKPPIDISNKKASHF